MALNIGHAEGTLSAASSTVNITKTGFGTVKFALIFASVATAASTATDDASMSVGLMAGALGSFGQASSSIGSKTGGVISEERRSSAFVAVNMVNPDTLAIYANWSAAFTTDGLTFTKQSGTTIDVHVNVTLFGGDSLLNVGSNINGIDLDGDTTPTSVTGLGFQPNLMFGVAPGGDVSSTQANDGGLTFGCAALHQGTTLTQWSTSIASNHAQVDTALDNNARNSEGSILRCVDNAGTDYVNLVIDSFDSDGYTYSWTGTHTDYLYLIALEVEKPTGLFISDGTIGSSATSFTSNSAVSEPVLALMVGCDGVRTQDTNEATSWGLHITQADQIDHFTTAISNDPNGTGTSTLCKTLRSDGGWEALLYDTTEMTATFSLNSSNQISLASITNAPARTGHVWYLMISEPLGIKRGTSEVSSVRLGSSTVSRVYRGTNRIF